MKKHILKLCTIFKKKIFKLLTKLGIMSFQNQSKIIIERTLTNPELRLFSNMIVNPISVEEDMIGSGLVKLTFTLTNPFLSVTFKYSFGKNQDLTSYVYQNNYKINSEIEFDFDILPQIQLITTFIELSKPELLNCYNRLYPM